MMTRMDNKQMKFHLVTIENLVPEDHFLRKLYRLVDFSFIYEEIEGCYCQNNGRPCVDPVILMKYLLIGFLFGIESERRIEQEIQVNMAYRTIPPYPRTDAGVSMGPACSAVCLSGFSFNVWKKGWWTGGQS